MRSWRASGVTSRAALDTVALQLVILDIPTDELRARIDSHARAMFDDGIDEEAVAVWRRCPDAPALTGLGYAEALAWRRGEMTRAEAIASADAVLAMGLGRELDERANALAHRLRAGTVRAIANLADQRPPEQNFGQHGDSVCKKRAFVSPAEAISPTSAR